MTEYRPSSLRVRQTWFRVRRRPRTPDPVKVKTSWSLDVRDSSLRPYDTKPLYPVQDLMTAFHLGGGICFYDLVCMRTIYVVVPQL